MARNTILGVTVGIGSPYSELAVLASSCFTEHTGIHSVILGPDEFEASQLCHPAALRLKLFDYLSADQIIYFDADWFCLNPWTPPSFGDSSDLFACRDFVLTDEWPRQYYDFDSSRFTGDPVDLLNDRDRDTLRHDYIIEIQGFAKIQLPCSRWINSGLLLMNRSHHREWLDTALGFYLGAIGHHRAYYEQPALLKALEHIGLSVRLLPRKLNVLAAYEAIWPDSVIGLHIKAKRHSKFLAKVHDGSIADPQQVRDHFLRGYA